MLTQTVLRTRRWLSSQTFEITLERPSKFDYIAGQRIRIIYQDQERDYSIVSAPDDPALNLCIRLVPQGAISNVLSDAVPGTRFQISGPHGYFVYQQSSSPTVFVATGTGIAPFSAMALSGVSNFTLLHGVNTSDDLYYAELFHAQAARYVPCLSDQTAPLQGAFQGRVTAYLEQQLPPGKYTFYLCGRQAMIHDATHLIDERFHGSKIYTEIFY